MKLENIFIYLVIHGAHHLYFRLFWLRDVAEALARWNLDHEDIIAKAYKLRIERLLGLSIQLVQRYFGTEIPGVYDDLLVNERKMIERMGRLCIKAIHGPAVPNLQGRLNRMEFALVSRPGYHHRLSTLWNIAQRWKLRHFIEKQVPKA